MLRLLPLLLALFMATAPATAASPVKARVPSGTGVLLVNKRSDAESSPLLLFKEPALGRIAEIDISRLPPLAQAISCPEGTVAVIVTAKKAGWFRIVYDEGEREGWIAGRPSYRFFRWEELLRNRPVTLIGGLRKEFYQVRRTPNVSAEIMETLGKGSRVTSLDIDGDWLRSTTSGGSQGWLRWRDENGRLVIAINL